MKENFKLGAILMIYCAFFAGILAYVNTITKPVIGGLKEKTATEIRLKLIPEATTFVEKKAAEDTTFVYYIAKNAKGEILGYTLIAAKRGYSSVVKTMVALDKNFTIVTLQVFDQNETPGLGTHAIDRDFPDRFKGKTIEDLKVDKDGGTIKSITGATITTRAITNSLHEAIRMVKEDLADETSMKSPDATPLTLSDRQAMKEAKQRQAILPAAKSFEARKAAAESSFVYYLAKDGKGNPVGYTFVASKKGYCSTIKTLVALNNDLKVQNLKVLKHDETPGLGSLCLEDEYLNKFKGKGLSLLKLDKDGGPIVAVTGATITSRAVTNSIRDGIVIIKKDIQGYPPAKTTQGGKS
jgi:electron transport complex protein RnfG